MILKVTVAVLLCSTYCLAQNNSTNFTIPTDDKTVWEEISKVFTDNGMARTDDTNLNLFDQILAVNAKERGTGLGRTDTDVFLYEGDIVVTREELTKMLKPNSSRQKRAVIRDTGRNLWGRIIYYVLDRSLGYTAKAAIQSAIKHWTDTLPCIRWVDKSYGTTVGTRPTSYMHFFVGGGCYSQVGRVGGGQKISIGRGCEHHGIAVHEIGHAMGLWHEQSRPDRDEFVTIHWNNIIPSTRFNFQKQSTSSVDSLRVEYDYDSVMHYGSSAFARASGLRTITSKKGAEYRRLGQRNGLSDKDKRQVQRLYKCTTVKPTAKPKPTVKPAVCKDSSSHSQWCSESKKLSLCKTGMFKQYMMQHCCTICMLKPKPVPKPTGCVRDEKGSCGAWKSRGYCESTSKFHAYMQKHCCKSCCFDIKVSTTCVSWKQKGYCSKTYVPFMKKNCKKTCNYCA